MSDFPPLHDYSRSRAVVMGTWDYEDEGLCALPAARHSLERMVGLLTGELCGWPEDRVSVLRNRARPGNIPDDLISLFTDVTDIALFYFVGHGQIDPDDQLCLGLTRTVTAPKRRASTSLQFDAVRKALLGSDAKTKIVILDCCFAGLATRRDNTLASVTVDVMDKTSSTGAYTMAATGQFTTALFETDTPEPQTYFTKYLVDTVEAGIPSEEAGLRLHHLYAHVREALARDKRPTPQRRVVNDARDFVFAHNVDPMPAPTPAVDDDAERDYLRHRIDDLAETLKTIADAVTARPPVEPVAPAEPVAVVPPKPAAATKSAAGRTPPARPEPVKATPMAVARRTAAAQTGAGGTTRQKPVKTAPRRKPPSQAKPKSQAQAQPQSQPKKSAATGKDQPRSQGQGRGQGQSPTQTPAAAPMPGPRVPPVTSPVTTPLSDFFAGFASEVAAAATGTESGPGARAGATAEEQSTTSTTRTDRSDRSDRTEVSDLDRFFDGIAEEISRRRRGATPDD